MPHLLILKTLIFVLLISSELLAQLRKSSEADAAIAATQKFSTGPFTLDVDVECPASQFLPEQGTIKQKTRIAVNGGKIAIVWKSIELPRPKYFPPNSPGYEPVDYDQDGSLIVGLPYEGATLLDSLTHEDYYEFIAYSVSLNGEIVQGETANHLDRHEPNYTNTHGITKLRSILCALGRPYAADFVEERSRMETADNMLAIEILGDYSPYTGRGLWKLTLDPATGYLMRRVEFAWPDGDPLITCSCEGRRQFGDWLLAEQGSFKQRTQRISVRLNSIQQQFDNDLEKEARSVIARAFTSSVLLRDFRDNVNHPIVRRLQAQEIQPD